MSPTPASKGQRIASWILSALVVFPFLPSAFFKVAQPAGFLEQWSTNYPAGSARPIGLVELLCVILYLVPRTAVLGAILMTGYLGGAIATHVHMGDPKFVVPLAIGILSWGALFLRETRLRALLPLVSKE